MDILAREKPPKKLPLEGLVFCIAGMVDCVSNGECQEIIERNGGSFAEGYRSGVTHVLSSSQMEIVIDNEYKCQFFPTLRPMIEAARASKIPVVSFEFVQKCISMCKKAKEGPFILFAPKQADDAEFQSSLDPRVQDLVNLLFDESEIERTLADMRIDPKRLLSIVTKDTIKQAYTVLSELDGLVRSPATQPAQKAQQTERIKQLSTQFYNIIPHQGATSPLTSPEAVKEKIKMMEAITDIEVAATLMKEGKSGGSLNQVDIKYRKLKAKLEPLEKHTQEYSFIEQYVTNSHAQVHNNFKIEIDNVFKLEREGEAERFQQYSRLPNHRLLWHGSRFTNYIGIITQGLRIAPPEAPVTGYFLGKGIYFADMVSKSAEYCHATKENNYGILLLCEVALGRWFQIAHGKFISKEDLDGAGFHSTKGCGETAPDPSFDFTTTDGYIIPLGRESDTGVLCSELPHNEFIVYDSAQVKIRYLIKINFTFDDEKRGQLAY